MRRARVVFALLLVFSALFSACRGSSTEPTAPAVVPYSSTDLRVGTGAEAINGQRLTVHYTGWLYDANAPGNKGGRFETSVGGAPYSFVLGSGQVIRGWEQGLVGMKVGGLRRLVIPPNLAYGTQGAGATIPPSSTLIFEVELLSVAIAAIELPLR